MVLLRTFPLITFSCEVRATFVKFLHPPPGRLIKWLTTVFFVGFRCHMFGPSPFPVHRAPQEPVRSHFFFFLPARSRDPFASTTVISLFPYKLFFLFLISLFSFFPLPGVVVRRPQTFFHGAFRVFRPCFFFLLSRSSKPCRHTFFLAFFSNVIGFSSFAAPPVKCSISDLFPFFRRSQISQPPPFRSKRGPRPALAPCTL